MYHSAAGWGYSGVGEGGGKGMDEREGGGEEIFVTEQRETIWRFVRNKRLLCAS